MRLCLVVDRVSVVAPSIVTVPPAETVTVPVPLFLTVYWYPVGTPVVGSVSVNVPVQSRTESVAVAVSTAVTARTEEAKPLAVT